ncbi:hypothetical protein ACO2JO_09850 [Leptospira interrogans]
MEKLSGKKRQTESLHGQRVILVPSNDLADLSEWYAGGNDGVNQARARKEKEKICIVMFSPDRMQHAFRLHRSMA